MSSSNNGLSVKVYYIENKSTKEIRKFSVDADVVGNFEYLSGKIRQVFPDLLRKDFELFWKDNEEDFVTISSDGELDQAIETMPIGSTNLKLYVKGREEKKTPNGEHSGVTCDGCDGKVIGYRYKCSQCYDFDLCSTCEGKNVHPSDHELILIKTPRHQHSGHYMRHPKFSRGGFGGRGSRHFFAGPCHGRRGFYFRHGGCGEGPKKEDESAASHCKEEKFKECVGRLASAFGLDPDVAVSSAKSFFEDVAEKSSDPSKKPEDSSENSAENLDEFAAHLAQTFGVDPAFVAHVTTTMFPQQPTSEEKKDQKKNEDETSKDEDVDFQTEPSVTAANAPNAATSTPEDMETGESNEQEQSQSKADDVKKPDIEQMVSQFAQQFGFDLHNPPNTEGFGEMLHRMFQPFTPPQTPTQGDSSEVKSNEQDLQPETEEEPKKPDEFVFLEKDEDKLTEEEKYQKRLNKALHQMASMGFDNDNGWLSQLLVSKDLSIGRVLDALNPQN